MQQYLHDMTNDSILLIEARHRANAYLLQTFISKVRYCSQWSLHFVIRATSAYILFCHFSIRNNIKRLLCNKNSFIAVYEPSYLDDMKQPDSYDKLDVRLRGYDYPVLDTFQNYMIKIAKRCGISVLTSFPMPARQAKITQLKHRSSIVDDIITLLIYERITTIQNVQERRLGLLCEILSANLPIGVELSIDFPNPDDERFRYVPDLELYELQYQLDELSKEGGEIAIAEIKKRAQEKLWANKENTLAVKPFKLLTNIIDHMKINK
ncbi:hypothetical protein GJ496_005196 [Pomphorhynchus laevis]|nr:hypothetical protein GJ496_005196 [Pomphorhynchus laevis]